MGLNCEPCWSFLGGWEPLGRVGVPWQVSIFCPRCRVGGEGEPLWSHSSTLDRLCTWVWFHYSQTLLYVCKLAVRGNAGYGQTQQKVQQKWVK